MVARRKAAQIRKLRVFEFYKYKHVNSYQTYGFRSSEINKKDTI